MNETIKPVSFTLGESDRSFISDMVENGRFGNRTEVVRAGLRLLQDYESTQKLRRLRSIIAEGDSDIVSGRLKTYDSPNDLMGDVLDNKGL